jgi:hypothetical protein
MWGEIDMRSSGGGVLRGRLSWRMKRAVDSGEGRQKRLARQARRCEALTMISGGFCRAKAAECEELALLADDHQERAAFRDLAMRWRLFAVSTEAERRAPARDAYSDMH